MDQAQTISVSVDTLDGYCRNRGIDRVDVVKIDTEGNDYEVLAGATNLLKAEAICALQFEYNYRWVFAQRFLKNVFNLVDGLPYTLGKLQRDHVAAFKEWHFELDRFFEGNYVLLHHRLQTFVPHRTAFWDEHNTMRLT